MATTKIWTAAEIREKLVQGDTEFLTRGLMAIYEYQTPAEKISMETTEDNGVGFSGFDANILSSFAEQWRSKQWLSPKQMEILRKRMPKYSKQLARIAEEKRISKQMRCVTSFSTTTIVADASETPVVNGLVKFSNGAEIHCQDLAPKYNDEGEVVEWTATYDGVTYTLFND